MGLGLREEGVPQDEKPDGDGGVGEIDEGDIEGEDISHPRLIAHEAEPILELGGVGAGDDAVISDDLVSQGGGSD